MGPYIYRPYEYNYPNQYSSETMCREIDHSNQKPTTMHTKIDSPRTIAEAELTWAEKWEQDRDQRMIVDASHDSRLKAESEERIRILAASIRKPPNCLEERRDARTPELTPAEKSEQDRRQRMTIARSNEYYPTDQYSSETMRRKINRRAGYPLNYQIDDGGVETSRQIQDARRSLQGWKF
jgi:hypothetical protein